MIISAASFGHRRFALLGGIVKRGLHLYLRNSIMSSACNGVLPEAVGGKREGKKGVEVHGSWAGVSAAGRLDHNTGQTHIVIAMIHPFPCIVAPQDYK